MSTYNVGDFFLYRTWNGTARYLGVVIQKKAPVDKYEPRLLLLAGVKDEINFQRYATIHAPLDVQDRFIFYINEIRKTNSDQEFNQHRFSIVNAGLGKSSPFCGRLSFQQLTPIKNISSLQKALEELEPMIRGDDPQNIIRFFQHIQRSFNSASGPKLSL